LLVIVFALCLNAIIAAVKPAFRQPESTEESLLSNQFSKVRSFLLAVAICLCSLSPLLVGAESLTNYASHHWDGIFTIAGHGSFFILDTGGDTQMSLRANKNPLRISFIERGKDPPLLQENRGCNWDGDATLLYDPVEHFAGLGHGFFGRSRGLDLKGEIARRNCDTSHGEQAPLIVPFYMFNKGYGIFLNSTFPNSFNFGSDRSYEFSK
jgi:hypothetical protein